MKRIAFLFCLFLAELLIGQEAAVTLYALDSKGGIDSITIGIDNSATIGVDPGLNEVDIYDVQWYELELRVIQRDSLDFNCLSGFSEDIYFDSNKDFKMDFRPPNMGQGNIYTNFEIQLYSSNPPVKIISNFDRVYNTIYEDWSRINVLGNDCNILYDKPISSLNLDDTLFILQDTMYTLITEFGFHESVNLIKHDEISVYPNPANDLFVIDAKQYPIENNIELWIYDIWGREILSGSLEGSMENVINISNLKGGTYTLLLNVNGFVRSMQLIKLE